MTNKVKLDATIITRVPKSLKDKAVKVAKDKAGDLSKYVRELIEKATK